MKSWPILVLGLLGLLACAGCGGQAKPVPPPVPPPRVFEFKSVEGNFSVLSPVDLSPVPYDMNTALGQMQGRVVVGQGLVGHEDIQQFVVAYVDFPVALDRLSVEQLTALFEEGPAQKSPDDFLPYSSFFQGAPVARDYYDSSRGKDGSRSHMNRYLLVGHRYYVLQVSAAAGKLDTVTAGEFLRSFKFLRPVS